MRNSSFSRTRAARRKEVYWAQYRSGIRIDGPQVGLPTVVAGLGLPIFGEGAVKYGIAQTDEDQFPDPRSLVALSENPELYIDEPMYIRRPDAIPTSERAR